MTVKLIDLFRLKITEIVNSIQMHTPEGVLTRDKEWGKSFDEKNVHLGEKLLIDDFIMIVSF